jgi:hypothetical protein
MTHVRLKMGKSGVKTKKRGTGEARTYFQHLRTLLQYPAEVINKHKQHWFTCETTNFIIPMHTIRSYGGSKVIPSFLTPALGE